MAEVWVVEGNDAGSYTSPCDKATLHTTEGGSIEGAIGAYRTHNSWPHKTVDYRKGRRRIAKHVLLDRAARALRNTAAAGETNRDGTIQYELVGNAATILSQYDEADWLALGAEVIGPDCRACGIPLACTVTMPTYPPPNGERLGSESTRLTRKQVTTYVGILGHCNWPENTHGDPGPLTAKHYRGATASAIDLILEGAGATTEDIDMATAAELEARIATLEKRTSTLEAGWKLLVQWTKDNFASQKALGLVTAFFKGKVDATDAEVEALDERLSAVEGVGDPT